MLPFLQGGHGRGEEQRMTGVGAGGNCRLYLKLWQKPIEYIEAANRCVLASGTLPLSK